MSDLNKSSENVRKHSINRVESKQSNESKNTMSIKENRKILRGSQNLVASTSNNNTVSKVAYSGLDSKYLESSQYKVPAEEHSNGKWEEHQDEFENLTSGSMSSLGSVPDEYTDFQPEKSKDSRVKKTEGPKDIRPEIEFPNQPPDNVYNYSQRKEQPEIMNEKEDDGNFETEMENEETRSSGLDVKYTLNVPSMITHLKRKDNYLESLDIFLNENLNAIADLIKIKKEISSEVKDTNVLISNEKKEIIEGQKQGKVLEKEISRTLEENYCLRYQNDETIKLVHRVRDKITQKYHQYEKQIEDLYLHKEKLKERVNDTIKVDTNQTLKARDFSKAMKAGKTYQYTDRLTSNEYQID